jgi:hypothetical protein
VHRVIGFLFALGLTLGGILWLLIELFATDRTSGNLVAAACIMIAAGAYWSWVAYISGAPNQER